MGQLESLQQLILSKVDVQKPFEPMAFYDSDGDCIEFFIANDAFYAERLDGLVTVYYSQETGEIVGSLIKNIKKFIAKVLETAPGFKIEIQGKKVQLEHLFTAKMWLNHQEPNGWETKIYKTYKRLRKVSRKSKLSAQLEEAVA